MLKRELKIILQLSEVKGSHAANLVLLDSLEMRSTMTEGWHIQLQCSLFLNKDHAERRYYPASFPRLGRHVKETTR